ncbi:PTS sugar transporter subunit IIC [Enterococcus canis]|nr:PTS transporter subunit EIIC [Enterococcus canis]
MGKVNTWIERIILPFASKLSTNRFMAAIRDAFVLTFPIGMAASIVAMINSLILDPYGLIAQLLFLPKFFPNLVEGQKVFANISNGTLSIMSIFIVFLVAENLAKVHKADSTTVGITAISSFMIIYPVPQMLENGSFLSTEFLGAKGLFVAMIIGSVVGEFLPRLANTRRLQIRMPEQVPPAVSRSFSSLLPVLIVILTSSIVSFVGFLITQNGFNQLVYDWIQTPLRNIGANMGGVLLITVLLSVFWIFGEYELLNGEFLLNGGALKDVPYAPTYTQLTGVYAYMGGAGVTLGLLIAILLVSKRGDYREVAKLSLVPGIFNINEPVIFGLPIVLNPILGIPFVLAPVVSVVIAYFATNVFHWVVPAAIGVAWTIPGPLGSFLATGGSIPGLILGFVCLASSVLVYLPFVKIADRQLKTVAETPKEKVVGDPHEASN